MSDDEIDALNPDGQGSSTARSHAVVDRRAPRFSWTPAYEATFFRSLCDSVQLGLRENSSFKAEAWERAMVALQDAHGAHPAKSHLINKSDNARKRFRLWRGLREDPEFHYNAVARTVSASEEAWKAHIEREPLSRALRGRPFDHEDYMEVLYPDVIGSGGAPKRVMKPRRRTDGTLVTDDSDMPGTGVLNLQSGSNNNSTVPPTMIDNFPSSRPVLQQTPSGSSSGSLQSQRSNPPFNMQVPTLNTAAVLTPPDEVGSMGRKRSYETQQTNAQTLPGQLHAPQQQSHDKRRRTSEQQPPSSIQMPPQQQQGSHGMQPPYPYSETEATTRQHHPDNNTDIQSTVQELSYALRTASQWRERALDIFFRDFADEDLDLQVKVSEGILSVEGKAMVFCKMPVHVRQHWVRRLREGQGQGQGHHRVGAM